MPLRTYKPNPSELRRLKSIHKSGDFIRAKLDHLQKMHAGEYVLVCDGKLVLGNPDSEKVEREAKHLGLDLSECLLQYFPRRNESYFF